MEEKKMNIKIITIFITMLSIPMFSMKVVSSDNQSPIAPNIIGPCESKLNKTCNYTIISIDPQGDNVFYEIKYSDDPTAMVDIGPYHSGISVTFSHCWCTYYQKSNPFYVKVRARDSYGHTSDWSIFKTNITNLDKIKTKTSLELIPLFLQRLFQSFPFFEKILKQYID
jgi:hypothetical protein